MIDGLEIAKKFHETYERLAPSFGHGTRKYRQAFDPNTPNGRLMIAVCGEVGEQIHSEAMRIGFNEGVASARGR